MPALTATAVAATKLVMDLQFLGASQFRHRIWDRLSAAIYPLNETSTGTRTDNSNDSQDGNNSNHSDISSQQQTSSSLLVKTTQKRQYSGAPEDTLSCLEPILAWLQTILLWHDPAYSFLAINGLTFMFLIVYNWAPRFYSSIMLIISMYNFSKLWFCYIWPEIRVPPAEDHDVDRWTYLHPHLLTLPELMSYVTKITSAIGRQLNSLVELRRNKPGVFCALVCATLGFVASIGNCLRGITIVYFIVIGLATAPGIYLHVLPENIKEAVRNYIVSILTGAQSPITAADHHYLSKDVDKDNKNEESSTSHEISAKLTHAFSATSTSTLPTDTVDLSKLTNQDYSSSTKRSQHDMEITTAGTSATDGTLNWIKTGMDVSRSYFDGSNKSVASSESRKTSIVKNSSSDDEELITRASSSCGEDEFEIISEAELLNVPKMKEDVSLTSGHCSTNLVARYRSIFTSSNKSIDLDLT